MSSQVFEEALELDIGLLEAGPPTSDSYPYPSLTPTGTTERRTFRVVVLENSLLRATFVPALGGRLLWLLDKRTDTELLSKEPLQPLEGGRRGARLDAGIELHLGGRERLTSLGLVQYAAEEADEERPAGLWMAEAVTGTGLSWHLHVSLPEDRAELRFEARVFNRMFDYVAYNGGFLMPAMAKSFGDGKTFVAADGGQGLAFLPERGTWSARSGRACSAIPDEGESVADQPIRLRSGLPPRIPASHKFAGQPVRLRSGQVLPLRISRFDRPRLLAPRQLDTWVVSIVPFSGLEEVSAVSRWGAMSVGSDVVRIQVAQRLAQAKLVLLTVSGQKLEAPLTVEPERVMTLPLPEAVRAAALMEQAKNVILKWEEAGEAGLRPLGSDLEGRVPGEASRPRGGDLFDASNDVLEGATFDVATRAVAHTILGMRALADSDLVEAGQRLEQALLYNAEDHLAWWLKGMAGDDGDDEAPELLNAHYLAPLEPALRAESFLRMPLSHEKDPSPLLKPMADHPENFVEVAALLVEGRLFEQASRWIDEALRYADLSMLRYLLAYSHLEATGLDIEASKQVSAAAAQPLGPPYPWRRIETVAIHALSKRFPNDARLSELVGLMADVGERKAIPLSSSRGAGTRKLP